MNQHKCIRSMRIFRNIFVTAINIWSNSKNFFSTMNNFCSTNTDILAKLSTPPIPIWLGCRELESTVSINKIRSAVYYIKGIDNISFLLEFNSFLLEFQWEIQAEKCSNSEFKQRCHIEQVSNVILWINFIEYSEDPFQIFYWN